MATVLPTLGFLVASAASLSTSSAPGAGRQDVLLNLDEPAAIHLSARSPSGTACTIIDKVRGPFASSGNVGGANCEVDLLLDAGQYKVRLESPKRGKGQVVLLAAPFQEQNTNPPRLLPATGVLTTLRPGQQASYWLSLKERGVPWVRISGRHAGDVRLWRNGQWLEPQLPWHQQFSPRPGQPVHEWWLDTALEPGEYKLVIYGRESAVVAGNSIDDSLTVETGFRSGPSERIVSFTLPASGVFAVEVPKEALAGVVTLEAAPPSLVQLQAIKENIRTPHATCSVEKGALAPECSVLMDPSGPRAKDTLERPRLLLVRGPPGTRGQLEWAQFGSGTALESASLGGYYGPSALQLGFKATRGSYFVGVHDLPNDTDSAPLGCQLEQLNPNGDVVGIVAHSVPALGDGEKMERQFNYQPGGVIWFEVKSGGNLFQRVGLSSRRFRITTKGERKSSCEVYRLESTGKLSRLTQAKAESKECNELLPLNPGVYQLSLNGGFSGVESLSITPDGESAAKAIPSVGGCVIPSVGLEDSTYRLTLNRLGPLPAAGVRGLMVQPLPLTGAQPLHLQLDARQSIQLPVASGSALTARSSGGAPLESSLQKGARADVLTLFNQGDGPLSLTLSLPGALPSLASPVSYQPQLAPLTRIVPDVPAFFDFELNQTQAVLFDVDTAGLYNVTTLGLLSTDCRLRTPAIHEVASNRRGGRGHNCLIQTYLQKGRYLFTATTFGSSRGRGAMMLSRKPAHTIPGLAGEGEEYFRAGADELVQQEITVKAEGRYELGTTSQGTSSMLCRIDDPEGWPLEGVPSSCAGSRELRAGTYLWTQLPLTVESMRRTQLRKVREAETLKGNKPHRLDYFTWYTAALGPDGQDEFLFTLEGEARLDLVLTAGMQGRIFLLQKGQVPKPVEVVPPMQPASSSNRESYKPESGEEGEEDERQDGHADEGEGEGDGEGESEGQGEGSAHEEGASPTPPVEMAQAQRAPPPPSGAKLTLPAGDYKLVTVHSKGDVGVTYQLHLGSATMLPGMTRSLPAPSTVPLFVPKAGTLRLHTEGEVDVRCRLFAEDGRLVVEASENGSDWNCAIAEPVGRGRYTVVLETETQRAGETKLSIALPAVEDQGPLVDGAKLTLSGAVVSLAVPPAQSDAVQEIAVQAQGKTTPLSCALETTEGMVLHRLSRVSECTWLLRPQLQKFKVRLWTTDGSVAVVTSLRTRPISQTCSGAIQGQGACSLSVPRAGRYRTSAQAFCLSASEVGLLRACGPEVSLEAGPAIFAQVSAKAQSFTLEELIASAEDKPLARSLSRRPFVQGLKASKTSVFLLEARVRHGERNAPACQFDGAGTVQEQQEASCFAASRADTQATSRLWTPSDQEVECAILRRAIALPEQVEALMPGRRRLTFSGVGRFGLPKSSRARLEVTLPKDAWAVLLGDGGETMDFCTPHTQLRRCVLTGQAGSVMFISSEGQADVTTVLLDGGPTAVAFTGLYEDAPRVPGTLRLAVPAEDSDRQATVEGALACTITLSDGTRLSSCRGRVPAKQRAELLIEHPVGALRVMVHAPGRERWARLGLELPTVPGPTLSPSTAVPLQSGRIDRTLVLDKEAVVRVTSESGVCGLFRGNELLGVDGLDAGCELVRVLPKGTYRLLVRAFASRAQPGSMRWTAEPVTELGEGVGKEDWLAPGEVRLFRFDSENKGRLGLGVQAQSELLECAVYGDTHQLLGEGCHQYLNLAKGRYLLTVRNPPAPKAGPMAFRPVLLGLSGEKTDVPEEYLRDFFERMGMSR